MSQQPQDEYAKKSRLSKCLMEVLKDHEAIAYFIQYMDSCKASAVLRFWLDAESFQASTWTRIRTHSLQSVSKSSLIKAKKDLSSDSLTQSINKDITSPVSGASLDIIDSIAQTEVPSSSALTSNLDQSITEPTDKNEDKVQQLNNDICDITKNVIPSDVSADCEQKLNDCDSRIREKCKDGEERNNLSLPIESCDSSTAEDEHSDSAISYRDIASPSPTSQVACDSQSSAKSSVSTSGNLADKLKKSKYN